MTTKMTTKMTSMIKYNTEISDRIGYAKEILGTDYIDTEVESLYYRVMNIADTPLAIQFFELAWDNDDDVSILSDRFLLEQFIPRTMKIIMMHEYIRANGNISQMMDRRTMFIDYDYITEDGYCYSYPALIVINTED